MPFCLVLNPHMPVPACLHLHPATCSSYTVYTRFRTFLFAKVCVELREQHVGSCVSRLVCNQVKAVVMHEPD
jgi:hypothetical protein